MPTEDRVDPIDAKVEAMLRLKDQEQRRKVKYEARRHALNAALTYAQDNGRVSNSNDVVIVAKNFHQFLTEE